MTTVNPANTSSAAAGSNRSSATAGLASNFETFLTLLTAQLQNQDPLSPLDTKDFTQQLVQFSGVEQQLRTNDLLASLQSLNQASAGATAVAYLGKTATAKSAVAGLGATGGLTWDYNLPAAASANTIKVVDSNNRTVFSTTGELARGQHSFTWNGQTSAGRRAAEGTYRLVVEPVGTDQRPVSATVTQTGVVSGVDLSGATPLVRLNGADMPLSSITNIRLSGN